MKTYMDLLLTSENLFVNIYVKNYESSFTYALSFDDLVQNQLFTFKDLYLYCVKNIKLSFLTPEYDLSKLKVEFLYSSISSEESIKKFLKNARIASWKKHNVSHTMQIKFSDSPEDQALYEKLLEIDNRSEFIKSVLRITFQNHVTCASSAE